jgi:hypothetical protein
MASTADAAAVAQPVVGDGELSLFRLYVLRLVYAAIGLLEGSQVIPAVFAHEATARGVIPALLSGFCLMCLVGLRYPRQMLPLLLFEMAWKYIWFFAFGLPQYMSGQVPPTWAEDFQAIAVGVVIMPLVIPWGYVWRNYVVAPGDRWR